MPPHEDHKHTLSEMDALLQEMSHLNAGHVPDHIDPKLGPSLVPNFISNAFAKKDAAWEALSHEQQANEVQQSLCEIAFFCKHGLSMWPPSVLLELKTMILKS